MGEIGNRKIKPISLSGFDLKIIVNVLFDNVNSYGFQSQEYIKEIQKKNPEKERKENFEKFLSTLYGGYTGSWTVILCHMI